MKTEKEYTLRELAALAGITKPGMKKRLVKFSIHPFKRTGNVDVYNIKEKQFQIIITEAKQ